MESLFNAMPFTGYVYPNETVLAWTVLVVVYPYLTGLVAGAFTVSSLYQVFGMQRFKPVAHLALLTSLCCMLVVPVFYRALSLGSYDLSEKAMRYDRKWIFALAVIGIPAAHGLHGYVGFVFGSLKSREWWSSDLMPAVFLFSAIISGTALLVVLYVVTCRLRKVPIDLRCLKGMALTLWGFMMFTLLLEGVEFASLVYRGREGIEMIMEYVKGPLIVPFAILQFGVGSLLPLLLLTFVAWRGITGKAMVASVTVSAFLVLFAVLMMRWNVVIGGQEIAKTGKGLLEYHPALFGREGILAAVAVVAAPFVLLSIMVRLFPPWAHDAKAA
jgi:Ni/Fe-hydrogenase subunit HybB-like protein